MKPGLDFAHVYSCVLRWSVQFGRRLSTIRLHLVAATFASLLVLSSYRCNFFWALAARLAGDESTSPRVYARNVFPAGEPTNYYAETQSPAGILGDRYVGVILFSGRGTNRAHLFAQGNSST